MVAKGLASIWISGIDVLYVSSLSPADGTIEVGSTLVGVPLVYRENVFQLLVAHLPDSGIDILIAVDTIEIVEIHLVCLLSLPAVQAEFIHHFVCEEAGLDGGITDSLGRNGCCHYGSHDHCQNYSFHNSYSLKGYYSYYQFLNQRGFRSLEFGGKDTAILWCGKGRISNWIVDFPYDLRGNLRSLLNLVLVLVCVLNVILPLL